MAPTTTSVVHYFDTAHHSVPCGAPGFAERSTKHARQVTCSACMAALRAGTAPEQAITHGDASHAW
jgi:hypothetical protein